MKNIKVLGTGCTNCKTTVKLIDEIAKENGVEIYILVDKSESPNAQSEKIYKECAEENYTLAPSDSAIPDYMEMLGRRAQVARLTK